MILRNGLSLGLSILLFSGCAWAQRHGFGSHGFSGHSGGHASGGGSFGGQSFGRQSFRGGSTFHRRGFTTERFGFAPQRHFRQPQFGFSFHGNRFHQPHHSGLGFGYSPFFYGGYGNFGSPYGYGGGYGTGSVCDPRFSSPPYYCQPLYPNGPPSEDPGAYQGDERGYSEESSGPQDYDARRAPDDPPDADASWADAATPQDAGNRGLAPSTARYTPRQVKLTYDGSTRPAPNSGAPLVITSGHHRLVIVSNNPE